jgi:hypothetical protein
VVCRSRHSLGVIVDVTITPDAAAELRDRVARYKGLADAVMISGPTDAGYPMAESVEEARHLEVAYGPAQRWRLRFLSLKEFVHLRDHGGTNVHAMNLDGIPVLVLTTESNAKLRVELHGDRIRISDDA